MNSDCKIASNIDPSEDSARALIATKFIAQVGSRLDASRDPVVMIVSSQFIGLDGEAGGVNVGSDFIDISTRGGNFRIATEKFGAYDLEVSGFGNVLMAMQSDGKGTPISRWGCQV